MTFTDGAVLGHYKILRSIGAGGMGEVYLAEDTELERKIALKILPASASENSESVRRFVQEAKSASALNHPNILTIYEIGQFENSRFIATEYIEGETLREQMNPPNNSLPIQTSKRITVKTKLFAVSKNLPENYYPNPIYSNGFRW